MRDPLQMENTTVVHHLSMVDLVQPAGHGGRVGRCGLVTVFVARHHSSPGSLLHLKVITVE